MPRCGGGSASPRRAARVGITQPKKQKPVHSIRDGVLEAAIWANKSDKGTWYSVTPRRSYKSGEEWEDADSYGADDLRPLAKLLDLAHTFIVTQQQQTKQKAAA
jgi:hypothetical protein